MALETTKHFDAPEPPSALRASLGLVAARWGAFLALTVVASLALLSAALVVAGAALVRADGADAIRATGVVVLVDPQATGVDAQSVGALIRSIPGVADASFRSKDDALKDLMTRGLPAPDGRNPLPDVWTLHLVPAGDAGPLPGERFAAVVRAAAALPHVLGTRLDERWIARLDRSEASRRHLVGPLQAGALTALALLLFCAGVLAGGSLSVWTGDVGEREKSALALFGIFAVLVATAVAVSLIAALPTVANLLARSDVEAVDRLFSAVSAAAPGPTFAGIVAAAALAMGAGTFAGGRRFR